jgi:hypothetical protein
LKNINLLFSFFPLLLISIISTPSYARSNDVLIYIRDDVFNDYQNFVEKRDVLAIKSFSGKTIRRDVVDMIIAQQALKLGGFMNTFKYAPGKVNFRNTKMLQSGKLLISFDSYWNTDAQALADKLYISEPVIRNGEYIAGIYTSPYNKKVLQIKTLEDLKKLTSISTPLWKTDWQTLQSLPLKKLIKENSWLSMARMVNLQWIDFMLMPFHGTADQSFNIEKIHLVPVKNVGIVLKDSRHFVISKTHPQGKAAFIAINKGLKKLRKRGVITKAYTEAGFFVDQSQYKIINK